MFCPQCGKENKVSGAFCSFCGTSLKRDTEEKIASPLPSPPAPPAPKTTMRRKGLIVAITGTVAALAIGAGAFVFASTPTPIDEKHFPDQTFRDYIAETADSDGDGTLSKEEANAVEYIGYWDKETSSYVEPISNAGITSLEGVEYFRNLKGIVIVYNPITTVDLRKNKNLEYAIIENKELTEIDIFGCKNLEELWVFSGVEVKGMPSNMKESHVLSSLTYNEESLQGSFSKESQTFFSYAPDGLFLGDYGRVTKEDGETIPGSISDPDYSCNNAYIINDDGSLAINCIEKDKDHEYSGNYASASTVEYDGLGNISSETTFSTRDGKRISAESYNSDGLLTESSIDDYSTNESRKWHFNYNDAGILKSCEWSGVFDGNNESSTFSVTCNDNNMITGIVTQGTTEDEEYSQSQEFTYDEEGRLSSVKYDFEDDYTEYYQYSDDEQKVTVSDSDGIVERVLENNEEENLLQEIYYNTDGSKTEEVQVYYSNLGLPLYYKYTNYKDSGGFSKSYTVGAVSHYSTNPLNKTNSIRSVIEVPGLPLEYTCSQLDSYQDDFFNPKDYLSEKYKKYNTSWFFYFGNA